MCQHLHVYDNQVIGYWQEEEETRGITRPLENDLMRLEMDMDYNIFLWKLQSRLEGGGGARGGGESLVNVALFWVLPLPEPLGQTRSMQFLQPHPSLT